MLYVVYCHIEELEYADPSLAAKIRSHGALTEGPYAYKLTKTGYVLRATTKLSWALSAHKITAKHKPYDPKQTKLAPRAP